MVPHLSLYCMFRYHTGSRSLRNSGLLFQGNKESEHNSRLNILKFNDGGTL